MVSSNGNKQKTMKEKVTKKVKLTVQRKRCRVLKKTKLFIVGKPEGLSFAVFYRQKNPLFASFTFKFPAPLATQSS